MRKVFETCQVYYTILLKFIAFEFIVILKHIFCLPKKASITTFSDGLLTSLFSAIRLYYVAFLSFFYIQLFLTFFIVHVSPGSRFFRVQVFQGPSFLGSRFFRVRVQGLVPGFRSSLFLFSYKKNSLWTDIEALLISQFYSLPWWNQSHNTKQLCKSAYFSKYEALCQITFPKKTLDLSKLSLVL